MLYPRAPPAVRIVAPIVSFVTRRSLVEPVASRVPALQLAFAPIRALRALVAGRSIAARSASSAEGVATVEVPAKFSSAVIFAVVTAAEGRMPSRRAVVVRLVVTSWIVTSSWVAVTSSWVATVPAIVAAAVIRAGGGISAVAKAVARRQGARLRPAIVASTKVRETMLCAHTGISAVVTAWRAPVQAGAVAHVWAWPSELWPARSSRGWAEARARALAPTHGSSHGNQLASCHASAQ